LTKIYSQEELDLIERWWVLNSRTDFYTYRRYINAYSLITGRFIEELAKGLQKFYDDMMAGKRPILVIHAPPQHGKSFSVTDFISWFLGKAPGNRVIYASFSDRLGVRANRTLQRIFENPKYHAIFPEMVVGRSRVVSVFNKLLRNNEIVETDQGGYFRNTTVNGSVTGEGADLGVIDDPLKGRKEANSKTVREGVWDWLTDDFMSRFSDHAGLLMIMTRWHVDDPVGRILDKKGDKVTYLNYAAIDELGNALFPEHKSLEFLLERKESMLPENWQSLYQGNPVIKGGNIVKSDWWVWGEQLPKIRFRFIVADTAQKKNNWNDYTDLQAWGMDWAGRIHLLDHFHERIESPELRVVAKEFYDRHNNISNQPLRGMWIEDKSSGSGLLQELSRLRLKVNAVQRNVDKISRAQDTAPEVKSGKVVLYKNVRDVDVIVDEASAFPNGINDDAWDNTMNAIEVAFLSSNNFDYSSLV
jgi:predicted phage terminase large subunit-like protein